MAMPSLSIDGISIVVRGFFNAAIFSPAWLLANDLIGDSEYANAEISIITPDLANFRAGWLLCNVTPDGLTLSTTEPDEFERVRDAAIGILQALSHTPIGAMGINREVHFEIGSVERWHAIGDVLAPKETWEGVLNLPGMRDVTIWAIRPDNYAGRIQVQVQPSVRIQTALFVSHNDHYDLETVDKQPSGRGDDAVLLHQTTTAEPTAEKVPIAVQILQEDWAASQRRALAVIERVASLGRSR